MIKYSNSKRFNVETTLKVSEESERVYDLADRTLSYAKAVRVFVKTLPRTIAHIEDAKQLVRASGSVGANYIEANESLSKKDFCFRIKICRKEAKECLYWLQLIEPSLEQKENHLKLMNEPRELVRIFSAILQKSMS